jgi:hypothetical protein
VRVGVRVREKRKSISVNNDISEVWPYYNDRRFFFDFFSVRRLFFDLFFDVFSFDIFSFGVFIVKHMVFVENETDTNRRTVFFIIFCYLIKAKKRIHLYKVTSKIFCIFIVLNQAFHWTLKKRGFVYVISEYCSQTKWTNLIFFK